MKRRYDYDILRVLSMLGVIYLHTVSGSLHNLECTSVWNFSNIFVAFATPAVPLFFMMSGALLMSDEKTASLRILFQKRIPKLLVPLCAYTCLILMYSFFFGDSAAAIYSLKNILRTPIVTPYWFLYALIPIYLLSPMLKKMTDGLNQNHWHYMMGLWIICTLGLYTVRSFVPEAWQLTFTAHWTLNLNVVGGYLGYFLLGAYLERLEKTPPKKILVAIVAVMIVISIVGTRWDTYAHAAYSDRFTNYMSLFTFVLSSSIFLLAKSCLRSKEETGKALPLLAGISFCVYLIHPFSIEVVGLIWSQVTGLTDPVNIGQQIILYLCVTAVCIIGAVIASSIKPLCYLFTGQTFASACKSCNLFALFSKQNKEPD